MFNYSRIELSTFTVVNCNQIEVMVYFYPPLLSTMMTN